MTWFLLWVLGPGVLGPESLLDILASWVVVLGVSTVDVPSPTFSKWREKLMLSKLRFSNFKKFEPGQFLEISS